VGFGRWTSDREWLVVDAIDPQRVPELVHAIVQLGGQIQAVVPEHKSLEDRFLELLGEA
jgi:hypothetical protein